MENEIWKDILGYEGLYQISNFGRVKSLWYKKGLHFISKRDALMTLTVNSAGYYVTGLSKDNKRTQKFIHRLVSIAFIPNPENKETVNHINGIKTDNSISNLEWATKPEQIYHAVRTGLQNNKGINNAHSKLTELEVINIRHEYLNTKTSYHKLSEKYNVSGTLIKMIVVGKAWKHI